MTTIDCNVIWQDTSGNPISSALVGEEICILIQFESNPTSSLTGIQQIPSIQSPFLN